jgi:hypothetical protein
MRVHAERRGNELQSGIILVPRKQRRWKSILAVERFHARISPAFADARKSAPNAADRFVE